MPNVMAALSNIAGALCSTPQNLADAHYYSVQCSNAAKTRNPLTLAGVPLTNERISAASGPKFTILLGHAGEISLRNKFFPIVHTCLSCEDTARQNFWDGAQMAIFGDFFGSCICSEPRAAHFRPAF